MDTINAYVDNMFKNLPINNELLRIKENILSNMEEKYHELKAEGKSEHEAVGIVISEFGNIDELLEELGIDTEVSSKPNFMSPNAVSEFLAVKNDSAKLISVGVSLCILAAAAYCLLTALIADGFLPSLLFSDGEDLTGIIPLFLLVAIAVGLFIYSGMKSEKFNYIEKGISLDHITYDTVKEEQEQSKPKYYATVITGVVLCILSPIVILVSEPIFGEDSLYPPAIFLTVIMIAVFLFVYYGTIYNSYTLLLEGSTKTVVEKKQETAYGVVNGIIFMIATAIFLIVSFKNNNWKTSWIIFAVAGLISGIASSIIWAIYRSKELH